MLPQEYLTLSPNPSPGVPGEGSFYFPRTVLQSTGRGEGRLTSPRILKGSLLNVFSLPETSVAHEGLQRFHFSNYQYGDQTYEQ